MSVAVLKRAVVAPKRSRLSKLGLLLVALFAGILAVTGCTAGSSGSSIDPINPANRPTTITGYTNGQLPSSQLYVVSSTCTLYRPTVGSYEAMVAAARSDGCAAVSRRVLPGLRRPGLRAQLLVQARYLRERRRSRLQQPRLGQGRRPA